MTSRSRAKGNTFERELVDQAKSHGMPARRAWGSDGRSMGLPEGVDCDIAGCLVQAKRRRQLPQWLQIPEGADCVALREDRGETYVLMRWDEWLKLIWRE